MDFDKSFLRSAIVAKKLEVSWFLDGSITGQVIKKKFHSMPFKRRNLSYWRGIRYRKQRGKKRKNQKHKLNRGNNDKNKKFDMLYSIWKHRVRKYNDAFLKSPRRATRNFSKIFSDEASPAIEEKSKDEIIETISAPSEEKYSDSTDSRTKKSKKRKLADPPVPENSVDGGKDNTTTTSDTIVNGTNPILEDDDTVHQHSSQTIYQSSSPMLHEEDADCLTWSDELPSASVELKTCVVFHFLYLNAKELCIQTENMKELPRGHRQCPFCYLNCGSDTCLVMHCALCHGEHLRFQAARSEDGSLHIAVKSKSSPSCEPPHKSIDRDFCYVRPVDKPPQRYASVPFVKRTPCKIAEMDPATIRKKTRFLSELGAEESALRHFLPNSNIPIRQYYHSRSNEPMLEGEWDIDSDEEEDENWLVRMSEELLDEFEDVTLAEKRFAKLWNRFIRKHIVTPDLMIPSKCMEFLTAFSSDLIRMDLRQELLLHLCGLWDSGLISSSHLSQLMSKYDNIKHSTNARYEDGKKQSSD